MDLRELCPTGGHLAHLVPLGQQQALCGFQPSSRPGSMRRSVWMSGKGYRPCLKCRHAAERLDQQSLSEPTP